jgi:hypothetical protein
MRRRLPRSVSLLAGAIALLLAPDCATKSNTTDFQSNTTAEEPRGVTLTAATWTRSWDKTGVTPHPEGGFSVDTDLGYRVHVTEGWLTHHSVSFSPCEPAGGAAEDAHWWSSPIKSARAHAEDKNPSTIEALLVEDLTSLDDAELGAVSFPPALYCRAHWLVARSTGEQISPEGVDMGGSSVRLSGTWSRGGVTEAFSVDTWWPHALLLDIEAIASPEDLAEARDDGASRFAFVTLRRPLGRAFDGVDFETSTEDQIAGWLLDNLVAGAHLSVDLWSPSAN